MKDPKSYRGNDGALREDVEKHIRKHTPWKHVRVDYAYACLDDQDLDEKDALAGHWGEHWKFMDRIATTDGCKRLLRHAKQDVHDARIHRKREISMVIICRSGRHHSVGIARLLRDILYNAEGGIGKCENLSRGHWDGLCTTCSNCNADAARDRRRASDFAMDFWSEMRV